LLKGIGIAPIRIRLPFFVFGVTAKDSPHGALRAKFRMPLALVILVFDGFPVTGNFLLGSSYLRGGQCLGMGWEGFRKHAIDFVGTAAVVLHNLIDNIRHETPFEFEPAHYLSRLEICGDNTDDEGLLTTCQAK
jgi:hypothetical protein